jgi:hypothetical protein
MREQTMRLRKIRDVKLPTGFAILSTAVAVTSVTCVEVAALKKADHPAPYKVSCLGCHSDKRTLAAMADKSGDALYLVHTGEVTLEQLNRLQAKGAGSGAPKVK